MTVSNRISHAAPVLLVLAVAVVVYAGTLNAGFTWDDHLLVVNNPRIADPSYVHYLLLERTLWRPLKRLSLMADYALWGLAHPGGFHATNIALHAGATLALYALARALGGTRRLATIAALLFAVHPVHVEAVANISHRKEPMALLFTLLGFVAYIRARSGQAPGRRRLAAITAGLCYLLAMLSKEVGAVMFPVALLVFELGVASPTIRIPRRRLAWLLVPFVAVLALFTFAGYLGSLPRRFSPDQVNWVTGGRTTSYATLLLGVVQAFGEYASLLVTGPYYLDRAFELPAGVLDSGFLGGVAALAIYLALLASTRRSAPLAFFGLAWYGLNLLPVSNVVPLTQWLVAERFLYVPSAGVCLAFAVAVEALATRRARHAGVARPHAAVALTAALVIAHGTLTVSQCATWTNESTLWRHTLASNPASPRGLYGLALELESHHDPAGAEQLLRRAVATRRPYPQARYALARLLLERGRFDEAIDQATRYAAVDRRDAEAYLVVGNALLYQGCLAEAVAAYGLALERRPNSSRARYNLANALSGSGRADDAMAVIEAADHASDERLRSLRNRILTEG